MFAIAGRKLSDQINQYGASNNQERTNIIEVES